MLNRLAVVAVIVLTGCAADTLTGSDPVVLAASPSPSPTASPSPSPEPSSAGPSYYRAWFEGATLVHANLSHHHQNVRACIYSDNAAGFARLWTKAVLAVGGETVRISPPSAACTGAWGVAPITLQLYGLVGDGICPDDPHQLGAITARTRVSWDPLCD